MLEENNVPPGETPDETTPPGETPPKVPGETPGPTQADIDTLKAALKKANAEAAQHRHKANELDKLKEQIEAEKLSDKERLEAKLTALQSKYDTTLKENQAIATTAEIRLQAAQLNFDQRAASRLIEETAIERDANGNPTNIPDLVKQLVKDYPGLVSGKASTNTGGATNPSRTQSSQMAEVTEDYIAKLTPAIYDALPMEQKRKITEFRQAHTHVFGRRSTF
jgi:hypothetical protein